MEISTKHRYLVGPAFLLESEETWPTFPTELPSIDENNPEVRWVGAVQLSTDGPVSAFVEKPSRCQHLLRVVANVLRFVNNTRSKTSRKTDEFTAAEIQDSRSSVIHIAQRAAFGNVINDLERER